MVRQGGARAYTVGGDIVFGRGGHAPETPEGSALLAHELVHVGQQRGGPPFIQKQAGPPRQPQSLFRPLTYTQLQQLTAQRTAPIRRWLQAHLNEVRLLSARAIVVRVQRNVSEAADMGESELRATILEWAAENDFTPQLVSAVPDPADGELPSAPARGGAPLTDNVIVRSVKRAVRVAIDGVGVQREHGRAVVSVSGATVGLRDPGGTKVAGTLSWGGTLGLEAERGDFHFSAGIGIDSWEMKLSFGSDTAVPDVSRLESVFTQGEAAMRHIVRQVATFRNLDDASRIKDAIRPYTEPVSTAIEALQGIAQAPRVNVGISASGPGLGSTTSGTDSRATAITATLTIRF